MAFYLRYLGPVVSLAPANTTPPTIIGIVKADHFVSVGYGEWTYTPSTYYPHPRWSYEFSLDGVVVQTDKSPVFLIPTDAAGKTLTVRELAYNQDGIGAASVSATVGADDRAVANLNSGSGIKDLSTTGSITSGSYDLTVASATGFTIGDQIIVEIGTESGAGLRGTMGVGGTWPMLNYADATARDADTTQANNTYCWIQSDGTVHRYSTATSLWGPIANTNNNYYFYKASPLSLVATITAIDVVGNVLTLDTAAKATATAAPVHFDNEPLFLYALNHTPVAGAYGSNYKLTLDAGTYNCSQPINMSVVTNQTLQGAGKTLTTIRSPKGCPSIYLQSEQGSDNSIRDLHLEGNVDDNGFGLNQMTETSYTTTTAYHQCGYFHLSPRGTMYNCKVTNAWRGAFQADSSNDCWAINVEVVSAGHQLYIQWLYNIADSTRGGMVDSTLVADYVTGGFEGFRHVDGRMIRCSMINGGMSQNTSGGFIMDSCNVTFTANSQKNSTFWPLGNPMININSNIANTSGDGLTIVSRGGQILFCNITQASWFNSNKDIDSAIIIGPYNKNPDDSPNVYVIGGYPLNPELGGLIDLPDAILPVAGSYGSGSNGPRGVATDGDCVVVGIRVKGAPRTPVGGQFNNINVSHADIGTAINVIADTIMAVNQTNNITNADYDAAGAAYDAYIAAA